MMDAVIEPVKQNEKNAGEKMLRQVMKICGIERDEHILSWRYFNPQESGGERLCLVTVGGEKVNFIASEQKAYVHGEPLTERLSPERIDGISRKKPKKVAGVGRKRG